MNENTRALIRAKGISIWLRADLDVLLKRIKRRNDRPLLKNGDPAETLQNLMDQRHPVYAEADMAVQSRDVAHDTIVEDILAALAQRLLHAGTSGEGTS
jgi:shikimate kinase